MFKGILSVIFIAISVSFFIAFVVLRFNRQRKIAGIFELISYAFLVAYTSQLIGEHNLFAISSYTLEYIAIIILFAFSIALLVYKLIAYFKRMY